MWAVRCDKKGEQYWLALGIVYQEEDVFLCWSYKEERILFQDRDDALRALRISPWPDKKVLVRV